MDRQMEREIIQVVERAMPFVGRHHPFGRSKENMVRTIIHIVLKNII